MTTRPRGFCRTATGFRAWIRVSSKHDGFNELRTRRFGARATETDMQAWRDQMRETLRQRLELHRQREGETVGPCGTFRADATRYLHAVRALPTFKERARDVALWVAEFGARVRNSIEAHEIRAVRDRWLTVGPRRCWQRVNGIGQWIDVPGPLAASTVNHRLRALANLWTVLDGRVAPNPAREVPEIPEPADVPRALDYPTIRRVLEAMSDQGQTWRAKPRAHQSLAKIRARVLAWTGITPKELAAIRPPDVRWDAAILIVPPRRKGRGAGGRVVPLTEDALTALRAFDAAAAYGRFRARVVLRAWQRACRKVLGRSVRLYDLRHSFVTSVLHATHDLALAQLLAGHRDPRTTRRYALAAILPTLRAGIVAFAAATATTPSNKEE